MRAGELRANVGPKWQGLGLAPTTIFLWFDRKIKIQKMCKKLF
jgi:hypothetical protein